MGAKSTSKTQIPAYIEQGGQEALKQAQSLSQMGYVPWMGPDVAAYDPNPAISANHAFAAFNMPQVNTNPMAGVATASGGGVTGYSAAPIMQAAQEALKAQYPGLYEYLMGQTINPVTGTMGGATATAPAAATAPVYDPNQDFNVYGSDARLKKMGKL